MQTEPSPSLETFFRITPDLSIKLFFKNVLPALTSPEPQIPFALPPPITEQQSFPFLYSIFSIAPSTELIPQLIFAASNAGPAAAEVHRIFAGCSSVFGIKSAISVFVPISASKSGV